MSQDPKSGLFSVSVGQGETKLYKNGQPVAVYHRQGAPARPLLRHRPVAYSNASAFIGAKLKVERAKKHLSELYDAIQAFWASKPHEMVVQTDPGTGEIVYRYIIKKPVPVEMSAIVGDIAHNLRAALDYIVCDLIRAHNPSVPRAQQRDPAMTNAGFKINKKAKLQKAGTDGKIAGVSPKAEKLILRLKASKGWNDVAWALHWLDIIDKHNMIVATASATTQITAMVGIPGMFVSPEGKLCIGGGPPGSTPYMQPGGTPTQFKRVFPMDKDVEIHRTPAGFNEEVNITRDVAFFQTEVLEGEPIFESLAQLQNFVERTLAAFERVI